MLELPMVFVAGLLGSAHCLGMCGPFALAVGSGTRSWGTNLLRQCVYTAGRVFTYGVLGAFAGFGGAALARRSPALVNAAAVLAVLAGVLLLYQGLIAAGVMRRRSSGTLPCLATSFFATFLRARDGTGIFLAGLFTGFLPCGLVYGFLALAASTGNLFAGAALMVAFGLGTAPVMMATGCGGSFISPTARLRLYRLAAWCVVLTGLLTVARGLGFVHVPGWFEPAGCPHCRTDAKADSRSKER